MPCGSTTASPLSQRDVQELLHERGVQVSHETLRQWNIKFAPLLTEELRHREPRRGSRWHLDEVCVKVGGVKHWLWRAVDEYGDVLDILLQEHRDTQAAKSFFCPPPGGIRRAGGDPYRQAVELWGGAA